MKSKATKKLHLNLSETNANNLLTGKKLNLKHYELGDDDNDEEGEFEVPKTIHTKIKNSRRKQKGVRIEAGAINFKKLGRSITHIADKYVAPALTQVQKVVPKSIVKTALGDAAGAAGAAGAAFIGADPRAGFAAGKTISDSGTDAFYGTNFKDKDALKQLGTSFGKNLLNNAPKAIGTYATTGAGIGKYDKIVLHSGVIYVNGNPNLANDKSTTGYLHNHTNTKRKKDINGGSMIANGGSMLPNGDLIRWGGETENMGKSLAKLPSGLSNKRLMKKFV